MVVDQSGELRAAEKSDLRFLWRVQDEHLLLVSSHQRYYNPEYSNQILRAFWDDNDHAKLMNRIGRNWVFKDDKFWFELVDLTDE